MELTADHPLYADAMGAVTMAENRLEDSTRKDYESSLRRFAEFCRGAGYPDPRVERFRELPSVMAAYIHRLSDGNVSQWPAEKLRAAVSFHYSSPTMLAGGNPHDRWVVEEHDNGTITVKGNPSKSPMIAHIMVGLNKKKKRSRTPTRASPMSLPMLTKMITFLEGESVFNETTRFWFSAVSSLCFYGMCRINEVLQLKFGDINLGLERPCTKNPFKVIRYGCFTLRDRKTDHDPSASRTYNLHRLPSDEKAAEAITFLEKWVSFAETRLHHSWEQQDYLFPALLRVPRAGGKKLRVGTRAPLTSTDGYDKIGVKWGVPMADNNFIQVLNIVAAASNINRTVLGDEIWFTTHCFRRGGAQHRFMFAPDSRRWSLKMVKWWGGWSRNEQSETLVRYLLDDVLDREEHQLGDALAPDMLDKMKESTTVSMPAPVYEVSSDASNSKREVSNICWEDVKVSIEESIRNALSSALMPASSPLPQPSNVSEDTAQLLSEFPEARTWRDYVTQYWSSDPRRHQYRAGVDMLPEEKKKHKTRLSKMRLIAEHVRTYFEDDLDAFEEQAHASVEGELTINKVCALIRRQRHQATSNTSG